MHSPNVKSKSSTEAAPICLSISFSQTNAAANVQNPMMHLFYQYVVCPFPVSFRSFFVLLYFLRFLPLCIYNSKTGAVRKLGHRLKAAVYVGEWLRQLQAAGGFMRMVFRNLPMEIVILTIIPPSFNPKFLLNFGKVNRFWLVLLTIISSF